MHDPQQDYFNSIADKWDTWEDLAVVAQRLDQGLTELGVQPDENVFDVGCGTGNLTAALLRRLSAKGRVTAADISPRMIEAAQRKNPGPRASWHCGRAEDLPAAAARFDRILCFSVWPHISNPHDATITFIRMLKPNGWLHVWHTISRARVNAIHAGAGAAVHDHLLAPATETATLFTTCGLRVTQCRETDTSYLVSAQRPE
jgi:demethylmenaquinone methyltransferase/2-methoxy-6-polyprenyl-1,4-benzoquinol methylase